MLNIVKRLIGIFTAVAFIGLVIWGILSSLDWSVSLENWVITLIVSLLLIIIFMWQHINNLISRT